MGAGCSPKRKYDIQYRNLRKDFWKLQAAGVDCTFKNLEVRGATFSIYFSFIGPASNGELFGYKVLRHNPTKQPSGLIKNPGDVDYTDFHKRDIPDHDKGCFEAGMKLILPDGTSH